MRKKDLPDMRFKKGDKVSFCDNGQKLVGVIEIYDYGGALGYDYHTYDVFVKSEYINHDGKILKDFLYKHIDEHKLEKVEE